MKSLRSILGLSLALGLVMAISASASTIDSDYVESEVEKVAYMDLDSVSSLAEQEQILEARRTIIYGDQAWTIDNAVSKVVIDGEKMNVEAVPDFYELFPADWSVPDVKPSEERLPNTWYSPAASGESSALYYGNRIIDKEDDSGWNTTPFYRWNQKGDSSVGVVLLRFASDKNALYNAGFVNEDTGSALGWLPGLTVKSEGAMLESPKDGVRYGAIVSMVNKGGSGTLMVDYTDNWPNTDWYPITK